MENKLTINDIASYLPEQTSDGDEMLPVISGAWLMVKFKVKILSQTKGLPLCTVYS